MKIANMNKPVLVLNNNWAPINITSAYEAVNELFTGEALAVSEDCQLYDFNAWVHTWEEARNASQKIEAEYLRSPQYNVVIPSFIKLVSDEDPSNKTPKVSRDGILKRDKGQCQYCGRKVPRKDGTLDHVIPRSRKGKNTWQNLVWCCLECNNKKDARTPEEANMPLLTKPRVPHWTIASGKFKVGQDLNPSWETFLGKLYWNLALEE